MNTLSLALLLLRLLGTCQSTILEEAIEAEASEGQQAIFEGVDTKHSLPTHYSQLAQYRPLISAADPDLWSLLVRVERGGDLEDEYLPLVDDFNAFLEHKQKLDACALKASINAMLEGRELARIDARLAEHRAAFTMTLKEGHHHPTDRIAHFPARILASLYDKSDLDEDRADEMEADAYDHRHCMARIARLQAAEHAFTSASAMLGEVTGTVSGAMRKLLTGQEVDMTFIMLPVRSIDWDAEEHYREKTEIELIDSLIQMERTSRDQQDAISRCPQGNAMAITWRLEDTSHPQLLLQETQESFVLQVLSPALSPLETINGLSYLRLAAKRRLRPVIFSQFLAAWCMKSPCMVVDVGPFVAKGINPYSVVEIYDRYRRMFSDIQQLGAFSIEKLVISGLPANGN